MCQLELCSRLHKIESNKITKYQGINIDENLNWCRRVNFINSKIRKKNSILQIASFLALKTPDTKNYVVVVKIIPYRILI